MSQDNPNLDFLRAWAVLCVLASHVLNYFSFSIGPIGLCRHMHTDTHSMHTPTHPQPHSKQAEVHSHSRQSR